MATKPRGIESLACLKPTAAFAEASGGTNWKSFSYYALTLDAGEGVADDPELGGGGDANLTDPTQGMPTRPNPTGNADVPFDLNQIGFWLTLLFGAPVTEEDEGEGTQPFTHTWKSGGAALGLAHIENKLASAFAKMGDAFTASQWTLPFAPNNEGYRRSQFQLLGRTMRVLNAGVASSPAALPARQKIKHAIGKIQTGANLGALADLGLVLDGSMTVSNGALQEKYFDNTPGFSGVEVGEFSASIAPQIRFSSDHYALVNSWNAETPFAVRLIFEKSADLRMQIDFPNVIAGKAAPQPSSKGMMDMSPTFMCSKAADAPMCTVAVRNQVDSYAVAA